ncbi:MAG: universal stress protein [Saprospiraceae bacterium]|nr:universal stress protein [Saprospiraceae bacterium]
MKKIVVAIDFSSNSINALKQAVKMAAKLGAKVYAVHAYLAIKRADTMINVNRLLKEEAETQLTEIAESLELPKGASIKTKALKGDPVKAIEKYCNKVEAELIVMGTQGEQNDPEVFLGPVSGGLVKQTEIPILIIPNNYSIDKIENILFALKSMVIKDDAQLVPLKHFIKKFGAKLQVLQIKTPDNNPEDLIVSDRVKKLKAPIDYIEAENIYQGLTTYLTDSNVDLVCVMRRRRKFLELLFTRSLTKKDTFNSALPMLILRGHY